MRLFFHGKTYSFLIMKDRIVSISRRKFLQTATTGAIAAPFILESCAQDNMLQHACIGIGGMGWGDLNNFVKHPKVQIVAICDVDAERLKKASELVPEART
jgi:hypothetical protein